MSAARERLTALAGGTLDAAVVLGSGLSSALDGNGFKRLPYREFSGMPVSALAGHAGEVLAGMWHGKRVAVFAGRVHLYQGFSAADVTFNVRLAAEAGASTIILTNAAGGLNPSFSAGDIMLLRDHLNLTGQSPLTASGMENPFIDMLNAYDPQLRELAKASDAALREGVYAGVTGPAYETPAEAHYLRTIGADAVGMSTVLETIAARALGMRVLGLSLITNMVGAPETTHAEVTAMGHRSAERFATVVDNAIKRL